MVEEKEEKGKKEKGKKEEKGKAQKAKLTIFLEEKMGMKALSEMKAITPQELAKSTGVKISIANAFIRSLEAQGKVKCVGGYSGHRVYQLVKS